MPSRDAGEANGRRVVLVRTALVLLTLLALFLRVAFLRVSEVDTPLRADAREYALYAQNLYQHGVFSKQVSAHPEPDAFRSPGFPLLAAAVLAVSGPQRVLDGVLWLQALLGAALVPIAFALGRRCLGNAGALVSAALVALSPHLVAAGGYFLTEALYAFFLLAALAVCVAALQEKKRLLGAAGGLLFGCAWAVNETALVFPPLLAAVALLWPGGGFRAAWRSPTRPAALAMLLVFALFPLAWSARNALVLSPHALRASDRALATLTHGTYPDFCYGGDPRTCPYPYRYDPEQPGFASSWSSFARIFTERVRRDPLAHARWYLLGKPATLWSWNMLQGGGDVHLYPMHASLYDASILAGLTHRAMQALHVPLVLLAAIAVMLRCARRLRGRGQLVDASLLVGSVCVAATIVFTVFAPWPRYSVPLRPELYLVASTAAAAALRFAATRLSGVKPRLQSDQQVASVR